MPANPNVECITPVVTIIGAGITGLTVAHELVERGFKVQIIEKESGSAMDATRSDGCTPAASIADVGGVARTQWAIIPDNARICLGDRVSGTEIIRQLDFVQQSIDESPDDDPTSGQSRITGPLRDLSRKLLRPRLGVDPVPPQPAPPQPVVTAEFPVVSHVAMPPPGPRPMVSLGRAPSLPPTIPDDALFVFEFDHSNEPNVDAFAAWLKPMLDPVRSGQYWLRFVVQRIVGADGSEYPTSGAAEATLHAVISALKSRVSVDLQSGGGPIATMWEYGTFLPVVKRSIPYETSESPTIGCEVVAAGRLVPGEHGYRFFAGFYRHLRDTLKRTPIYDDSRGEFGNRTVHDNLREVRWQAVADPERAYPTAFPRKPVRSITAARDIYRRVRRDLGYRPSDIMRFVLRILRFMTSCSERRAECYEALTWWDFLSLRNLRCQPTSIGHTGLRITPQRLPYGRRFQVALRHSPQALVAMKAELADARTQGNVSVQLLMDNLGLHEMSDSTLNGPTSEAWFRHWRTYLQLQGVRFLVAEVTGLEYDSQSTSHCQKVGLRFAGGDAPYGFEQPTEDVPHYVVVATDLLSASKLVAQLPKSLDLDRLRTFAQPHHNSERALDPEVYSLQPHDDPADPRSRYQTLTGLQLFYPSKLSFADAHIYFAQSPWGLSAVSQYQYWRQYRDLTPGEIGDGDRRFLSNLSIDIGAWQRRRDDDVDGMTPNERTAGAALYGDPKWMTADAIAGSVERQIRECFGTVSGATAPYASHYHIDDCIAFDHQTIGGVTCEVPVRNKYPYLINLVDDWRSRPQGEPWSTHHGGQRDRIPGTGHYVSSAGRKLATDADINLASRIWVHDKGGYWVYLDSLVFAGTYMRTFTRLGTMESANESARHAVNAILDHLSSTPRLDATGKLIGRESLVGGGPSRPPAPPWDEPSQIDPMYLWTPHGDYCETWNVEDHEIDDLNFAKLVDRYLYEAEKRAETTREIPREYRDDAPGEYPPPAPEQDFPHMFDLLELDTLPDLIDDDADALRVFDVLTAGLQALRESDALDEAEISRLLVRVRTQLQGLFRTRS